MVRTKSIVIDENGKVVDELKQRNTEIKLKLHKIIREFKEEQALDKTGKKRFGYRLITQLDDALIEYGDMAIEKFYKLTYDEINSYWCNFRKLISYLNTHFEVVANKQLFCSYMGINSRMYSQLENNDDDDIKNLMTTINDYFIGTAFTASETGNADVKGISQRLRAKGSGHSVVSAAEEMVQTAAEKISANELNRQIDRILGTDIKRIGN